MSTSSNTIRVAVTQAEPVWLDLNATVEKTCSLIEEAASSGAQLISFPECWIPGYPAWIWSRPVDPPLTTAYMRNSLKLSSPQMTKIQNAASQHKIIVVLGFSENIHDSLYIAQAIINADGEILTSRKKIKATHMERTVFGDSTGDCLNGVVKTSIGKVGALSCWEHIQPLLKYSNYAKREQIHVAAWPPIFSHAHDGPNSLYSMSKEGTTAISQTYAIESQSFVLHTTAVLTQKGIERMGTENGALMRSPGGGNSAVFGPDGRKLTEDIPGDEEGILYADIDFEAISLSKAFVDVVGHYSRPDLLWLGVKEGESKHVRTVDK